MKSITFITGGFLCPVRLNFACPLCGEQLEEVTGIWELYHPVRKTKCVNDGKRYSYPEAEIKELS